MHAAVRGETEEENGFIGSYLSRLNPTCGTWRTSLRGSPMSAYYPKRVWCVASTWRLASMRERDDADFGRHCRPAGPELREILMTKKPHTKEKLNRPVRYTDKRRRIWMAASCRSRATIEIRSGKSARCAAFFIYEVTYRDATDSLDEPQSRHISMRQFGVEELNETDVVRGCVMRTMDAFRSAGNELETSEGRRAVASDPVSRFVPGVSINSATGIDGLVGELHILRARLVLDVDRIQHDLMQYAVLGQAVARLTWVSAESLARMTVPDFAENP